GWISSSPTRSDSQTAYQILAASSAAMLAADTGDLWDSGKVMSAEQTHVAYNGQALTSSRKVHWKVRVWDAAGVASAWSTPATWTMGLINPADWQAQWIGEANPPTGSAAAPGLLLRREFPVSANLVRAVMHVSGLGYYTLTVNGNAATENLLEPGWTEYTKTVLYQTYDITPLLQSGTANAVGLSLGHGVYDITGASGNRYVKFTRSSGELKAIAHIRLEYADGSTQVIGTNAGWQIGASPITYENLFAGEDYDARLEVPGWNKVGMAASWPAATVVSSPGGRLHGLSRAAPPVRAHEVFAPKSVNPIAPGVFIYDMGQNASLMPRLVVHGPAGSRVRIIPAELLGTNGYVDRASATQDGVRPAWWQYTLKGGGSESWFPQFFYQGSRYWQVELGAATTGGTLPVIDSLEAVAVHADSPVTGSFETSSELFNKIWSLVRWAQRSNMMSVMTDCPHREKMPWLEQNQLNGPSLRYNFDMRALQAKVVNDMTDAQLPNGFVPNIAPEYFMAHPSISNGFRNSPEWGGSIVLVPWQQYQFSGDTTLLGTRYQVMKNYVAFLASTANNHIISTGLGDWYDVGPNPPWGSQLTPANLTATAHYFYFNSILSKTATMLGRTADATFYQQRATEIRNAFSATFFNAATGTYSTGSQTANAMPLAMG
ncbi:MAG: alpha-L-rhamnosidase, partial [Myxococcaceae bacterium]